MYSWALSTTVLSWMDLPRYFHARSVLYVQPLENRCKKSFFFFFKFLTFFLTFQYKHSEKHVECPISATSYVAWKDRGLDELTDNIKLWVTLNDTSSLIWFLWRVYMFILLLWYKSSGTVGMVSLQVYSCSINSWLDNCLSSRDDWDFQMIVIIHP